MIISTKILSNNSFVQSSLLLITLLIGIFSCNSHKEKDYNHGNQIDTLRVVTLYGPTSYFEYRGEPMGIDYENVRRFAEKENMAVIVQTVTNIHELIESLKSGKAHLAAYPVPLIAEYKKDILYAGEKVVTRQVLVQKKGDDKIIDVTQLVGKDIYVEDGSKYLYRLRNLNEELGGGINILTLKSDTLATEDYLDLVNSGKINLTVIDSDIAALYSSAYPNLDTSLSISAEQASSWAVAPGLDSLALKIDRWEKKDNNSNFVKEIYKRYYDQTSTQNFDSNLSYFKSLDLLHGKPISKYDEIFKKHEKKSGFDWKLLAAIAYCESRFNPHIESRFGAKGLMQVMPASAHAVGVNPSLLNDPDKNVEAAVKILEKLDKILENKIENPEERMKFVVASYNSGLGHIYDAMALAEKNGMDAQKWTGNVGVATLMKSRPEYYNDSVVKHGYFRGRETTDFVDHVMAIYTYLDKTIPS